MPPVRKDVLERAQFMADVFDMAHIDTTTPLTVDTQVAVPSGRVYAVTAVQGGDVTIFDEKDSMTVTRNYFRTLDELHNAPAD